MGRKKISIAPIAHPATRRATFEKRRIGVLKKAMELSILCQSTVSLTIYTSEGDVYVYSSEPYENVVQKFQNYHGPYRLLTNEHLDDLTPGKSSSNTVGFEIIKQPHGSARTVTVNNPQIVMPSIQSIQSIPTIDSSITHSNSSNSNSHSTTPDPNPSYFHPSQRARTLSNGFNQMQLQHQFSPRTYCGSRMYAPRQRMASYPNPHHYGPSITMKNNQNQIAESQTNSRKEESFDSVDSVSGKRRPFGEMMVDDLVPHFDVDSVFDQDQDMSVTPPPNITSAFLN